METFVKSSGGGRDQVETCGKSDRSSRTAFVKKNIFSAMGVFHLKETPAGCFSSKRNTPGRFSGCPGVFFKKKHPRAFLPAQKSPGRN